MIDVSQSVEPTHPHGLEFLLRDCRNVATVTQWLRTLLQCRVVAVEQCKCLVPDRESLIDMCSCHLSAADEFTVFSLCVFVLQFFRKRGVTEAMTMYELFNAVTGLNLSICDEDEAQFVAQVTHTHLNTCYIYLNVCQVDLLSVQKLPIITNVIINVDKMHVNI